MTESEASYKDIMYDDDYELLSDSDEFENGDDDLPDNLTMDQMLDHMRPRVNNQGKPYSRIETKKDTLEVLEKLLPLLKNTSSYACSDFNLLTDLVGEFVNQDVLQGDSTKRKKQISSICSTVMDVYPNTCFYQLLTRWSRKKKLDFIKDSLNTVLVLKSHFTNMSMHVFLDKCREITIIPPSKSRKKNRRINFCISMNTNCDPRGIRNSDQLVNKIVVSMRLMYKGISTIKDITLSRVRMDTVSAKQKFILPTTDNEFVENDTSGIVIESNALIGHHTFKSFQKRIWTNFDTVKLTSYLFNFVVGKHVKELMYQDKHDDERVMQFFYNSIGGQATRRMYMGVLVDVALVYKTQKEISFLSQRIVETCKEGSETDFVLDCKKSVSCYEEREILKRFEIAYNPLIALKRSVRYTSMRHIAQQEIKYQSVRCMIFHMWLQFPSNKKLKRKLYNLLFPDRIPKTPTQSVSKAAAADIVLQPTAAPDVERRSRRKRTVILSNKLPSIMFSVKVPAKSPKKRKRLTISLTKTTAPAAISPTVESPLIAMTATSLKQMAVDESRWTPTCGIISLHRLNDLLTSTLIINVSPGQVIKLVAAPIEIYSADLLKTRMHGRETVIHGGSGMQKIIDNGADTTIHPAHTEFNDPLDRLHVIRQNSPVFSQFAESTKADAKELLRFCMKNGDEDVTRRNSNMHHVINIGVKAEIKSQSESINVYGSKYFKRVSSDEENRIKISIGGIVDFIWDSCQYIQAYTQKLRMGGNNQRRDTYGNRVRDFVFANRSEFECITIAVTIIFPIAGQCFFHQDLSNDTTPGYSRTGCMDMIIEDANGTVYLLQVICNFRGAAGNALAKGSASIVEAINENIVSYFSKLQGDYRKVMLDYQGSACYASFITKATDIEDFFLDDDLPYVDENRKDGVTKWPIELFVLPIGPYRSISLSMVLDSLQKLKKKLCYDQLIELCFIASFQNSVLPIDKCLVELLERDDVRYQNEDHPFYSWMHLSQHYFGSHQGGRYPRFSSGSNDFINVFDGKPNEETSRRLSGVVSVLAEWINVIDSYHGKCSTNEIPYFEIKNKMLDVVLNVKTASERNSLEFGMFRLSIFTTYVTGLGLAIPGPHIHQISIPTAGTASAKHLINPFQCGINSKQKQVTTPVSEAEYDQLMEKTSMSLGCKYYHRTLLETLLCEGHPNRKLHKKDVFKKGQKLFHINSGGVPVSKDYGNLGQWIPLQHFEKEYKLIKINK